jgi:hypothetical protein
VQGLKLALLHEVLGNEGLHDPDRLAAGLKAAAADAGRAAPDRRGHQHRRRRAFAALDERQMLRACPACSAPARCWTGKRPPAAIC